MTLCGYVLDGLFLQNVNIIRNKVAKFSYEVYLYYT